MTVALPLTIGPKVAYLHKDTVPVAIFNLITFFIHAVVAALASMLRAVFTHLLPGLLALAVTVGVAAVVCTSCGVGSLALLRRRKRND